MAKNCYGDKERPVYPFTAIVAQDEFKKALILNAIDPKIGGVLLTGPKGTGKSTIVRSLEEIFPKIDAVENCFFGCHPTDSTKMCEACNERLVKEGKLPKVERRERVVTLPLSATEDRVVGSLNIEDALRSGSKTLLPGILAEANRNILYIDEVNLLPDHLVDMILDVSSSGWNRIEREGVSVTHPSNFVLVGSMNPEEGGLRPQISDRFGLHAKARRLLSPEDRIAVIKRRERFQRDPSTFLKEYRSREEGLKNRIKEAREGLFKVKIPQKMMKSIASICASLQVDGYRPDIVMMRAARAWAAFNKREGVTPEDVKIVSGMVLSHRARESGGREPPTTKEIRKALKKTPIGKSFITSKLEVLGIRGRKISSKKHWLIPLTVILALTALLITHFLTPFNLLQVTLQFFAKAFSSIDQTYTLFLLGILTFIIISLLSSKDKKAHPSPVLDLSRITAEQMTDIKSSRMEAKQGEGVIRTPSIMESAEKRSADLESGEKVFENIPQSRSNDYLKRTQRSQEGRALRGRSYLVGKRAPVVTSRSRGLYVWHELPKEKPWDVALGPTIRAAAPFQRVREKGDLSLAIEPQDIRIKIREYRAPFSIVLLVDLSLSMISSVVNLSRAITNLHKKAFRRRDRVGLVAFKGNEAFILQRPTTNIDLVKNKLWKARVSDFTPMAHGMLKAWNVLRVEKQRNKDSILMLIVISDGIANIPLKRPLSIRGHKRFQSRAQADALDVAHRLAREQVRNVVINTSHNPFEAMIRRNRDSGKKRLLTPTGFLMEIARAAKGSYYGLVLSEEDEIIPNTRLRGKGLTIGSALRKTSRRNVKT